MEPDERTPAEREIDHDTESMPVFWWNGYRAFDWVAWYDYGMRGLEEDREAESKCEGLESDELRDAMLAKDDADLGWALGLGRKISTIPFREIVESEAIRCEQLGPHDPEWTRVIYDDEREVFIAVSDSGRM